MKKIVLFTSGTLGDHLPFLALAQALQRRGYQVSLMINQAMHPYAQRLGLQAEAFTDIERGPEHTRQNAWAWNHWNLDAAPIDMPSLPELFELYLTQIQDMVRISQGADLLLATSIRSHGMALHEVTNIPWMTISMNAVTFVSPAGRAEQERKHNARLLEYQVYQPIIEYVLEKLGAKKSLPAWRPGWTFARHILLASSQHFSQVDLNQLQPHSSIDTTGFWFFEDPDWETWQPDQALQEFCARRPLALAFSSQPVEDTRRLLQVHVEAANLLGLPLLVQRGWAGFSEADLPDSAIPGQVMFADYLPHDWLFARATGSIQHGGIGSIARALRQGCPLLIEPFGNDQFYNANQVAVLGAGAFANPHELTADSLARTLEQHVLTEARRQRAAQVGAAISAEQGLENACDMIERYLNRLLPDDQHPGVYEKFTPPLTPRLQQAAASANQPQPAFKMHILQAGQPAGEQIMLEQQAQLLLQQPEELPNISCLMVTNDRSSLAQRAVGCFQRQEYPHKELVIIDEGQSDDFEQWIAELNDPHINYLHLRGNKRPLGELRNLAISRISGDYAAIWDDDDLYHPRRLLFQMAALQSTQADACCLRRLFLWWPNSRRLAISNERAWEGTLLARRQELPEYPALPRGSDVPVMEQLIQHRRVVEVDYPQLYLYIYNGANIWGSNHWDKFWAAATSRFSGERYASMLQSLEAQLQIDLQATGGEFAASEFTASNFAAALPDQTASEEAHRIPLVLHQTWKDENLPEDLLLWQSTWLELHPGWGYHLWTDTDLRRFIQLNYAWFLPIYDNYPAPIMRVDAARYFIMHHFGGVYVDLDFECLRAIDPLLEGKTLLLGLEPGSHLSQQVARQSGLERIVGNAFIASQAGHPFWEHVFRQLVGSHRLPDPLDASGPFCLTRAVESFPGSQAIHLEESSTLYPMDKDTSWAALPELEKQRLAQTAYAVHHWRGGWWRTAVESSTPQRRALLFQNGLLLGESKLELEEALNLLRRQNVQPMISCLMVTRNRVELAQRAVACFRNQLYPNCELLILDDDPDSALAIWVAQLADPHIRHIHVPDEGKSLGELRNLAVEKSSGEYLAQWDDDDLSDPQRLEVQMAVIQALQVDACLLERHQIWWPESERLAYSKRRMWESSFLCKRANLPAYPPIRKGEDSLVIRLMLRGGRVAVLDAPWLYSYVFHGANTFKAAHWEQHWQEASATFQGALYKGALQQMQKRLNLNIEEKR